MTWTIGRVTATALLLTVISAAVHVPGLLIGPSLDAAVFQVVGGGITEGHIPYVDLWDHKPPVIYLIVAIAASLAHEIAWPLTWALTVAANVAMALAVAVTCRRFTGPVVVGVSACLAAGLGGQYLVALGGGLSEPFSAAFAAGAFAAGLTAGRVRGYVGIGLLLGLSLATSFQLAPAILGIAVVAALRRQGPAVPLVGWVVVGTGAALAVFALGLWAVGGLGAAWDATVSYSRAYRDAAGGIPGRWGAVPWSVLALLPLVAPALIGILRLRHHSTAKAAGYGSVAWLTAAMLAWLVQDRFYAHYAIAVLPAMAVLAAIGLHDLSASVLRRRPWVAPAALMGACFLVAIPAGIAGAQQEVVQWSAANRRAHGIAAVVSDPTSPSSIWVWGNAPQIYLATERDPATRFPYLLPLVTPDYATADLVDEVVEDLQEAAPSIIVDAGSPRPGAPGFVPLLIDRPSVGQASEGDLLGPLRDLVDERYELLTIADGWPIYRLTGDVRSR